MAKIYCHIIQCNATVQYFAILHSVKENYKTENKFTFTFKHKNKRCSRMRPNLRQITSVL